MSSQRTVLIIDDEADYRCLLSELLRGEGWRTVEAHDGVVGIALAKAHRPDVVICDLSLPTLSGFEVCRAVRLEPALAGTRVVVSSGHGQEDIQRAAAEAGADDFVPKPFDPVAFSKTIARLGQTQEKPGTSPAGEPGAGSRLRFWGVRGSVPTPGPSTVRYGGNTSCVEVRSGEEVIILDAGTGLRLLGGALDQEFQGRPLTTTLLLSHTHWDHIQGLPFFKPLHQAGNRVHILGYEGAKHGLMSVLSGQMETPYFPITLDQTAAEVKIEELRTLEFGIGSWQVRAFRTNHPGVCYGYRLTSGESSVAYFPDTETRRAAALNGSGKFPPGAAPSPFVEFIRGVDVLILDSQYDCAEYARFTGWGHGCVDDAVEVALAAGVRRLIMFHHDPEHDDTRIDAMLEHARRLCEDRGARLVVDAAFEGLTVPLRTAPVSSWDV